MTERHADTSPEPRWIPGLAGVRGVAILLVLGFHAGLPMASGGLAGVTLFFVLSGYLIGSALIREQLTTGTLDVTRFLVRRMRRLLPSLLTVMAFVVLVAVAAADLNAVAEDSVLTLVYVANWARAAGDGMGWWNHAWSLSIEEQSYLLAPIGLVILGRWRSPASIAVIALLATGAIAAIIVRGVLDVSGAPDERIYFGTDTRADALVFGCLLAAIRLRAPSWTPARWLGPAGLVTLLAVACIPSVERLAFGSAYTVAAIASLAVVAGASTWEHPWTALSPRPLVWLGERSYSLYLVHVPVFMYVDHVMATFAPVMRVTAAVLVSLVLAGALFRYVERPTRPRSRAPLEGGVPEGKGQPALLDDRRTRKAASV